MQIAIRPTGLSLWDLIYSMNMSISCLVAYWTITSLASRFVDRADVLLGGMWCVVAVVFVFRDTRGHALSAGISRLIATCVSFALCFVYLLILPFAPVGLVALLGIGTLVMSALSRRDDIVTTGITTTVVMVVAAMSPQDAWQQPLLRLVDTVVGTAIGVCGKYFASSLFHRTTREEELPVHLSLPSVTSEGSAMNADLVMPGGCVLPRAPVASVDNSLATKLLPFVLGATAGSVDVISFLGLGGLLTAHVTGNLVILAAHVVAGDEASLSLMISVPVFIVALAMTRLLAAGLERAGIAALPMLLLVQFVLLAAFLAICLAAGPRVGPNAPSMIVAGMLGVSAMAVQNALVRIALTGAPSTAVLTTNITLLTTDVGEMLLGRDANSAAKARDRARRTWPAVAGFLLGCALGASCEAAIGLRSLVLPIGLALIALALGVGASPRPGPGPIT